MNSDCRDDRGHDADSPVGGPRGRRGYVDMEKITTERFEDDRC